MVVEQSTRQTGGLGCSFIRTCKRRKRGSKIADSVGNELSGGATLTRALILRRLLLRHALEEDEQFVGLLLPPSVAGVLANVAVTLARRVPVNLNYTVSSEVLNDCITQAGIKHVLTSRKFIEKVNLDVDAEALVERLTGRRTCKDCGRGYHITFDPSKEEGQCDACGGTLIQRDDDQEETIRKRLQVYADQTAPLISYYKDAGLLMELDGMQHIAEVQEKMLTLLQAN